MSYELRVSEDHILHVRWEGLISEEEVEAYLADYRVHLEGATKEEPLHFLVDAGDVEKISGAGRRKLVAAIREEDARTGKTAVLGATSYVRVLAGFLVKAIGRDDIRLFNDEAEALAWLRSGASIEGSRSRGHGVAGET